MKRSYQQPNPATTLRAIENLETREPATARERGHRRNLGREVPDEFGQDLTVGRELVSLTVAVRTGSPIRDLTVLPGSPGRPRHDRSGRPDPPHASHVTIRPSRLILSITCSVDTHRTHLDCYSFMTMRCVETYISQFDRTTPRSAFGSGYPANVIRRSVHRTRAPIATSRAYASTYSPCTRNATRRVPARRA